MGAERTPVVGREAEFSVLDAALRGVRPARHTLVVMRGRPGSGKSAMLRQARRNWASRGVLVVPVRFGAAIPDWDDFGVRAVLAAVRDLVARNGEPRLAAAVARVERLCREEICQSPRGRSMLLVEVARMLAHVSGGTRTVFLADDVDALAAPALALAPLCGPGRLVVASCRDEDGWAPGELDHLADQVVRLGPLPAECVGELLARIGGGRADDGLVAAVQAALGPLAGHPDTVSATVRDLREGGRLTEVNGRICLAGDAPILLPATAGLVGRLEQLGAAAAELMVLAGGPAPVRMDDLQVLATATGRDLADYGRAADRLVALGVLDCDRDGQLRCPCPALAGRLRADAGSGTARLHRAFAERMLDPATRLVDGHALADHLVLAGPDLPVTPALATFLEAQADRVAARDPARAADWRRLALRGLEPADRPATLARLARLMLRTGRFAELCDVLTAETLTGELAAALAVAALHTARPLPSHARDVLPEAAATCARWLAGEQVSYADLRSWTEELGMDRPGRVATHAELEEAAERWDLETLTRLLAGAGPGPATHPPALYRRVLAGYESGAWSDALSAARSLELAGAAPDAMRGMARLLAAEICAARGETREAQAWLAREPAAPVTAVWRAWVECGIRWRAGEIGEAFELGWRACRALCPSGQAWPLLARLALIAADGDRPDQAAAVLAEAGGQRGGEGYAARFAVLVARAAARSEGAAAAAAVELARRRGHLADLVQACVLAGAVVEDPQEWLYEAHELVRRLGATALRRRVRTVSHLRGVAAPRPQPPRDTTLSATDVRVLELIRAAWTNRQIAGALGVGEKTVEYHLSRLFAKTGCRTRVDLVAAAVDYQPDAIGA
jgi:DNA-binding CsgD family transcriptional regulator